MKALQRLNTLYFLIGYLGFLTTWVMDLIASIMHPQHLMDISSAVKRLLRLLSPHYCFARGVYDVQQTYGTGGGYHVMSRFDPCGACVWGNQTWVCYVCWAWCVMAFICLACASSRHAMDTIVPPIRALQQHSQAIHEFDRPASPASLSGARLICNHTCIVVKTGGLPIPGMKHETNPFAPDIFGAAMAHMAAQAVAYALVALLMDLGIPRRLNMLMTHGWKQQRWQQQRQQGTTRAAGEAEDVESQQQHLLQQQQQHDAKQVDRAGGQDDQDVAAERAAVQAGTDPCDWQVSDACY